MKTVSSSCKTMAQWQEKKVKRTKGVTCNVNLNTINNIKEGTEMLLKN